MIAYNNFFDSLTRRLRERLLNESLYEFYTEIVDTHKYECQGHFYQRIVTVIGSKREAHIEIWVTADYDDGQVAIFRKGHNEPERTWTRAEDIDETTLGEISDVICGIILSIKPKK